MVSRWKIVVVVGVIILVISVIPFTYYATAGFSANCVVGQRSNIGVQTICDPEWLRMAGNYTIGIVIGAIMLAASLGIWLLDKKRTTSTQPASKKEDIATQPVEQQKINIDKDASTPEPKYCFKCGKKIVSDAKLCPYCGIAQPQT